MLKHKFIVVSNRLPVSVSKRDGKLVYETSSGGLATAMSSLGDSKKQLWIGWPGIASDDLSTTERAAVTRRLRAHGCVPVFLSRQQVEAFYTGYANDTLWPLFHYFQAYVHYDDSFWKGYREVNQAFRDVIVRHADSKATIWVHDYHLLLLPALLRQSIRQAAIGFFLHIPFPSYEIFRLLPERVAILHGLLGADLIGFHTYGYARHFLSSLLRILGLENNHGSMIVGNRIVVADAFPIGVDYERFRTALQAPATRKHAAVLERTYRGRKVILSMDRLDYSKGIMRRLDAFEQFLEHNPVFKKRVVLVMIAVPSRTEVEMYQQLRDEIEQKVGRINGTYGTVDWTPISYQFRNLPFEEIVALQARADVALVTPLRDGMNLVAKEYVAAHHDNGGVLILSEMAGAVDELPEALHINPNDIGSMVEALEVALTMPKRTQTSKMRSMQRRLSRYTVQRWAADFTEQLQASKTVQEGRDSPVLTPARETRLIRQFKKSKRRLLLLDYDGTLREFAPSHDPALAAPPEQLLQLIKSLTQLPRTKVCIISGRPRAALTSWFEGLPVALAAEHGAWMKYEDDWSQQQVSLHEHKKRLLPILEHYAERTPGARIEQKDFALVWHYRSVPTELAQARNAGLRYELNQLIANTDLAIHEGAKIIEIKPRSVHKGAVVGDLIALYEPDFILAVGDDYTDEDMFEALPDDAHSIKVGLGDTRARYQLPDVQAVLAFLNKLTK